MRFSKSKVSAKVNVSAATPIVRKLPVTNKPETSEPATVIRLTPGAFSERHADGQSGTPQPLPLARRPLRFNLCSDLFACDIVPKAAPRPILR